MYGENYENNGFNLFLPMSPSGIYIEYLGKRFHNWKS